MTNITNLPPSVSGSSLKILNGFLAADRFVKDLGPAVLGASKIPTLPTWDNYRGRERIDIQNHTIEAFGKYLARIPTLSEMAEAKIALAEALDCPFDRNLTRLSVSVMLSAYPAGRPADPEAYFELMLIDLEEAGIQPAAIVAACQHLRRTSKFLPSISEVLEACRTKLDQYRTHLRAAEKAIETREKVERLIDRTRTALEAASDSQDEQRVTDRAKPV
ncbi:hypothetical protein KBI52_18130 [Microvirga sp. HBU67558]|uniref:hypothetical protein n=1 Tax=Microvirga TaxID=186650 RepID=UPI001B36A1F4|nr:MULTISPECIES: hypothetical protein [unclassified Microvirga]MBQ0822112.1 hypothetical protein [Microvirga sp. HBU67558]